MSGKLVGMMLFFLVLLKLFFKNVSLFLLAFIQNLVNSKRLTVINFIFPLGAFPKYLLVIYSIKIMKKLSQLFAIFCLSISINSKAQNLPNSQTLKLNILNIDAHAFPKILVSFKAENKSGIPFWNLAKNNLQLMEDGKSCQVSNIKHTHSSQPINVSIVVDHSGSMDEDHSQLYDKDGKPLFSIDKNDNMVVPDDYVSPIENAKKSIKHFTSSFDTRKDFISITSFGTNVDKPLALTQNENLINNTVEKLNADGKTALYDGMIEGVKQLKNAEGIKVLVVLTDGEDNTSTSKYTDVIEMAAKEKIPVYIVGLGDVNKSTLNEISEATNGQFFYTRSSVTLQSIYSMISQRVQAVYQLEYETPNITISKNERLLKLSASINNYAIQPDQGTYKISEKKVATVSAINTPKDNNQEVITNGVPQKTLATIQQLPKPEILKQSIFENEKDIFWIFGNIIVAGAIAAFILVYKKRKQEKNNEA